jgi:hypothetical protein
MPGRKGKDVQVHDQWSIRIVDCHSIFLVGDSKYALGGALLNKLSHRKLTFTANDHVNFRTSKQ